MELVLLFGHRAYGALVFKQSFELKSNVRGPGAVAILWKLATLILADAQPSHFLSHSRLDFVPWSTNSETLATRLVGELFGRQTHNPSVH